MVKAFWFLLLFAATHLSLLFLYPPSIPRTLAVTVIFGCGLSVILVLVFHPRVQWLAAGLTSVRSGTTPSVALTFDDGPSADVTPRVLAILREKAVPATFFCIGAEVERHPDLARQLAGDGHVIGNHSYSHHPFFGFLMPGRLQREIHRAQDAIVNATGVRPTLFRSPVGQRHACLPRVLAESSLTFVLWQLRSYDTRASTAGALAERIMAGVQPGGIVLFHDRPGVGAEAMLAALPLVIDGLRQRGFDFVTVGAPSNQ